MSSPAISLEPQWQIAHRILVLPSLESSALAGADLTKALAFQRVFASELFLFLDGVAPCSAEGDPSPKTPTGRIFMGEFLLRMGLNQRQTRLFDARILIDARKRVEDLLVSNGVTELPKPVLSELGLIALLQPWLIYVLPGGRRQEDTDALNSGIAQLSALCQRSFQVASFDTHPRMAPVSANIAAKETHTVSSSAVEKASRVLQLIEAGTTRTREIADLNLAFIQRVSKPRPVS